MLINKERSHFKENIKENVGQLELGCGSHTEGGT